MPSMAAMTARLAIVVMSLMGGAAVAGDTTPPAAEEAGKNDAPPCIRPFRVKGWSSIDDKSVAVTAHARKFKITFVGPCSYTKWSYFASLQSRGSCVRPGDMMYFSDPRFPGKDTSCMVKSVTTLPRDWKAPPKPRRQD